jgi:hypothetical protein
MHRKVHQANKGESTMKTIISIFLISILLTSILYAQTTSIQLPTAADTNSSFRVLNNAGTPLLRLNADGGFYFSGVMMTGSIPATGTGTRLMWYPTKSAFRVGTVNGTLWDDLYIGLSSIAMGRNTKAQGESSIAIGEGATANADYSMAIGGNTIANMDHALAIGTNATANGNSSTALGVYTTADGNFSTALGAFTIASGFYSTAIGSYVKAKHTGAFFIGDWSKTTYDSTSEDNQMKMRFAGGYRLYSNSLCSLGVYMDGDGGGWTSICDRNKKENFHSIDGEQILEKIRTMPITEWNYKGTDPAVKYIGPVAQDFYSAFHLGGTDSLGINSLCIDGVNIAAIQALEKRTAELQKANKKIAHLENQLLQQKAEQEKANAILSERIEKLSNLITSSITQSTNYKQQMKEEQQ